MPDSSSPSPSTRKTRRKHVVKSKDLNLNLSNQIGSQNVTIMQTYLFNVKKKQLNGLMSELGIDLNKELKKGKKSSPNHKQDRAPSIKRERDTLRMRNSTTSMTKQSNLTKHTSLYINEQIITEPQPEHQLNVTEVNVTNETLGDEQTTQPPAVMLNASSSQPFLKTEMDEMTTEIDEHHR